MAIGDFFSRADAKTRMLIVIVVIAAVSVAIYVGAQFLGGGNNISGHANVAGAPGGLQSVPGGQLNSEYARTLQQANAQAAQQAKMTGGSAVPTLMNVPQETSSSSQCTVLCGEQSDVTDDINNLVNSGKISQEEANKLLDLAKNNASVGEYEATLDELVKTGKITPEQARKMLETYKRQHANSLVAASAQALDPLIKSGQLPLGVATELLALQKQGASPQEYTDKLKQLVAEGKISPEVAQQLLAQYQQQHGQETAKNGVAALKQMAKSGQISAEAADQLAKLQQGNASIDAYHAALDKLVAEGKMTPETAAKLLQQYTLQKNGGAGASPAGVPQAAPGAGTAEAAALAAATQAVADAEQDTADDVNGLTNPQAAAKKLGDDLNNDLNSLVAQGKMSQDTANALQDLQNKNVSPEEYQKELDDLVKAGKISPDDAKRLMAKYSALHAAKTRTALPVADGQHLLDLQKRGASPAEYQQALQDLVNSGKLSPEDAKRLGDKYQRLAQLREGKKLAQLANNNASPVEYANELRNAVRSGMLSPAEAAALLQKYQQNQQAKLAAQAANKPGAAPEAPPTNVNPNAPGAQGLAALQQRLQQESQQQPPPQPPAAPGTPEQPSVNVEDFEREEAKARAEADALASEQKQKRMQALMSAMSGQAEKLVATWQQPITMKHQEGTKEEKKTGGPIGAGTGAAGEGTAGTPGGEAAGRPPLIKAGTILFAVLDTAVNSDYPDTPVMATVVQGKYKGAKLLGKLNLATGQDKVSLNFTLLDMDEWPTTVAVNAYAIDPDTARTVLASSVDHHYLLRYGSMIATSFVSGYSNAITQAGTSTTSIFGTSSTHGNLSPGNKLAVGLGQVGTTMGTAMQSYFNTPATIKINSGVAVGILFSTDVTGAAPSIQPGGTGSTTAAGQGTSTGAAGATAQQTLQAQALATAEKALAVAQGTTAASQTTTIPTTPSTPPGQINNVTPGQATEAQAIKTS
jgi:polyhydroxyalkanoate synthesis regulator phasin